MRILMLAQFYPPVIGGEERHVRNLSIALARRGHDVTVATLWTPGCEPAEEDEEGVKVVRLRGTLQRSSALFVETERRHAPPFPDPELVLGLSRLARRVKPDVVHAHNWMLHAFLPLKRRLGAPLVVTLHDYSLVCAKKSMMRAGAPCSGPGLVRCLICARGHYGAVKGGVTAVGAWVSGVYERSRVDRFLTVSRAVAEGNSLARFGVPFEVTPNFIPDDVADFPAGGDARMDELEEALSGQGYILFVGDLNRLKGAHVILEAYARLRAAPPLVMIGRRCEDTPKEIPANVHIRHSWPHASIMRAWSRCLFGAAPSTWADPCPTVVMEAMACGKPVIASSIGGSPDLVDDGLTGLITPPGDVRALAAAMQTLIDDPALRRRMAEAGLRKVETFKAGAVTPRIERMYESLIQGRGAEAAREARHAA